MTNISTEEFLAHYGVKGMKWGVRKSDEQIAREREAAREDKKGLTPEQRKFAITAGITVGVGAAFVGAVLLSKPIKLNKAVKSLVSEFGDDAVRSKKLIESGKSFISLSDDVTLPKGTVFHRVANAAEQSIDFPKYASYLDQDVVSYRSSWKVNYRPSWNVVSKSYKTKFEALTDTKIASRDSVKKVAIDVMDKPGVDGKTLRDLLSEKLTYRRVQIPLMTKEEAAKYSVEQLADKLQNVYQHDLNAPAYQRLLLEVKKAGYGGITDVNNTGSIAQHAVILIDDDIFKTTSSILTDYERTVAAKLLTQLKKASV